MTALETVWGGALSVRHVSCYHIYIRSAECNLHMNNIYSSCPMMKKTPTAEYWNLYISFPAARSLICITTNISHSDRISSQGTNIIFFFLNLFVYNSMHVYKINHNLGKIARNKSACFSQSCPAKVEVTAVAVEQRGEILHFSRVVVFVDICVQWHRAKEERRRKWGGSDTSVSWQGAQKFKKKKAPAHLTSHSSHATC